MIKIKLILFFLVIPNLVVAQSLQHGINLYKNQKYHEAKIVFQKFIKTHPNNPSAIEYLGDLFFKQKKWNSAASNFKKLVRIDKNNAVYHYKYAGAIGLLAKNNKLKALFLINDIKFHFKKAATLDPKFIDVRVALVQLYMELPKTLGGSIETAKMYAEELKPLDIEKYHQLINYITKSS